LIGELMKLKIKDVQKMNRLRGVRRVRILHEDWSSTLETIRTVVDPLSGCSKEIRANSVRDGIQRDRAIPALETRAAFTGTARVVPSES